MKQKPHDAEYWVNRPLTPEDKDWFDDAPNWVESYILSASHPHRKLIVDAVRDLYPVSVLEIGCNTGPNLLRLREVFPSIKLAGIDVSEKCIKRAKDQLKADFRVADYHSIPFPDKSFDVVLADAVLMYSNPKQIKQAIKEIDRVCKRYVIIVDRFDISKKGVRSGHVWARNYPALLTDLGYQVEMSQIPKHMWPGSVGWAKLGVFIVAKK